MFGGAARIGVQQADVRAVRVAPPKARREVLGDVAASVADAVDVAHGGALTFDRRHLDLPVAEDVHARRPITDGRPAVQRIVVAVHDEGLHAGLGEVAQAAQHANLCAHAALRPVVEVAGEQQGSGVLVDGETHEVVPGLKRRFAQGLGHVWRGPGDPFKRRVEMEVCGVDQADAGHRPSWVVAYPNPRRGRHRPV